MYVKKMYVYIYHVYRAYMYILLVLIKEQLCLKKIKLHVATLSRVYFTYYSWRLIMSTLYKYVSTTNNKQMTILQSFKQKLKTHLFLVCI